MKVVALISGGKDSCYNMMQCIHEGHDIVALANLRPYQKDELDSQMYQTVGHEAIERLADAMELPLFRRTIQGTSKNNQLEYQAEKGDEVEDLYILLKEIQSKFPIDAVSSGAIQSTYQRNRVENVCSRLGLTSLAYLWERDQNELLREMIMCKIDAIVIKVSCMGLATSDLGQPISVVYQKIQRLLRDPRYQINICGEGGEYETFTLDCPLFKKKLVVDESKIVEDTDIPFAPVAYLNLGKIHLEDKIGTKHLSVKERLACVPMPYKGVSNFELEGDFNDETGNCTYVRTRCVLRNVSTSVCFRNGELWLGNLTCPDLKGLKETTTSILEKLGVMLKEYKMDYSNVCVVHLYVRDMSAFSEINSIYGQYFKEKPPVRICVETDLCKNQTVLMDCYAFKSMEAAGHQKHEVNSLHIQSISHWAPANIGPYSQCKRVGRSLYASGQIGLVPGQMCMVSGVRAQCRLALRHTLRILRAMNNDREACFTGVVCYVTSKDFISVAESELRSKNGSFWSFYAVMPKLPKRASVEYEVAAYAVDVFSSRTCFKVGHFDLEYTVVTVSSDEVVTVRGEISMSRGKTVAPSDIYEHLYEIIRLVPMESERPLYRLFFRSKDFDYNELLNRVTLLCYEIRHRNEVAFSVVPVLDFECEDTVMSFIGI